MLIFEEVIHSIQHNKARSILAGFGVAWGIFILILLLGAGKGFQDGINAIFNVFAQKSMVLSSGSISKTIKGNNEGKVILFDQKFVESLSSRFEDNIEAISPEVSYNGNSFIINGKNGGQFQIKGVSSEYFAIKKVKTKEGRLINLADDLNSRRNIIIGKQVSERLFSKSNPIGQFLNIKGVYFKIVGVLESGSIITKGDEDVIFLAYNTFTGYFNQGKAYNTLNILLKNTSNTSKIEDQLREYISMKYNFSKDDYSALYIMNFETQVKAFNQLFSTIDYFLWFIGICLMLSGMVGISNIMLVIVKERTSEIGIRKAIGATSSSVLLLILSESVIITFIAGIIGMILGFVFLFIINYILSAFMPESLISHISVNLSVIILALVFIITAGMLAGLYPAKKAADTMPIEAIRHE